MGILAAQAQRRVLFYFIVNLIQNKEKNKILKLRKE